MTIVDSNPPLILICRHFTLLGGMSRIAWELGRQAREEGQAVLVVGRRFPDNGPAHGMTFHRIFQPPRVVGEWWRFRAFAALSSRKAEAMAQKNRGVILGFGDSYRQDILSLGNVDWNYPKLIPGRTPSRSAVYIKKNSLEDPGLKRLVLLSQLMRRDVLDLVPGFDPAKIKIIYPGVEWERFQKHSREETRHRIHTTWGVPENSTWLMFAAGGDFEKRNITALAKALTRLLDVPRWHILFVGATREQVPWPPELTERTCFLGRLADVGTVFPGGDLFVYPAWYEEFGLVVSEAMASGMAAVVSRTVGAGEVMSEENKKVGLLGDPTDDANLARLLRRFLEQKNLIRRLGEENRRAMAALSWTSVYRQYKDLWTSMEG